MSVSDACIRQRKSIELDPYSDSGSVEFIVKRGHRLSGRFMLGDTPVPDSAFSLWSAGLNQSTHNADAEGRFEVGGLPTSTVTFEPQWAGVQPFEIEISGDTDLGDLKMPFPGYLKGTVLGQHPIPKRAFLVQLEGIAGPGASSDVQEDGSFSLVGTVDDARVVLIDAQSPVRLRVLSSQRVDSEAPALEFMLDELTGSISFEPEASTPSSEGQRFGVRVSYMSGILAREVELAPGTSGGLTIPYLPRGTYRVSVSTEGVGYRLWEDVAVEPGADTHLEGGGLPLTSLVCAVGPPSTNDPASLEAVLVDSLGRVLRSPVSPNERAAFEGLEPGAYCVCITDLADKVLVKSAGILVPGENQVALDCSAPSSLKVVLENGAAPTAAGVAGLRARLQHMGLDGMRRDLLEWTESDEVSFSWDSLAPGEYRLSLVPRTPGAAPAYQSVLDLQPGERAVVEIPAQGQTSGVRFVDATGASLTFRAVRAVSLTDFRGVASAQLSLTDAYLWAGVPDGDTTLFFCTLDEQPVRSLVMRPIQEVVVGVLDRGPEGRSESTVVIEGFEIRAALLQPESRFAPPRLEVIGFGDARLERMLGASFALAPQLDEDQISWPDIPSGLRLALIDWVSTDPGHLMDFTVDGNRTLSLPR